MMSLRILHDAARWMRTPYVALGFSWLLLAGSMPAAQSPPAGSLPEVAQLHRGQAFQGDLRELPRNLPTQRERRPDRGEEPLLQPTGDQTDRAAQTSAPAAPAPSPGGGSGAGNFAGLDHLHFGAGWPPDTNGD